MKQEIKKYLPELIIIAFGMILFLPFIGSLHLFDWDEINFAESAREMILTGDYFTVRIDFIPFWEKPPLFIWLQVLSMKMFGINEFAARFPNTICGILTLIIIFRLGRKIFDRQFGILWVLAFAGSILPFFYFKSGIIDPWFNLFIFLAVAHFILMLSAEEQKERVTRALISGLSIGLAILTKGPVGFMLFILTITAFWIVNRFRLRINWKESLILLMAAGIIGSTWFLLQLLNGNYHILVDFIVYQLRLLETQDAGHGGFMLYHFVVLMLGVFPASVYALKGFGRSYYDNTIQKRFKIWMIILLLVVLLVFSMVRTKIVHYSSLAYFPVTYLAAGTVYKILNNHIKNYRWLNLLYVCMGFLYGLLIIAVPQLLLRKEDILASGIIEDIFVRENLGADVIWTGWESIIGVIFIVGLILFLVLLKTRKTLAYLQLFLNVTLMTYLVILIFVPRIEGYSQNALVEFCKDRQNEDCYVSTLGMKSYAHLFYADRQVLDREESRETGWLIDGKTDKPVYFIVRNKKAPEYLERYKQLEVYYEKNGYVFLKREPYVKPASE